MCIDIDNNKLLLKHLDLVLEANKNTNLTNIKDKEEAKVLHIEDSLASLDFIKQINGDIVDIGSGAGYPGIPLSILTGKNTTLIETVGKKAKWLKFFISELGIESHTFVINDRIEQVSKDNQKRYTIVTARALSSLSSLLELASPLLKENGYLICYKSLDIDEEFNKAKNIEKKLGFKLHKKVLYKLINNNTRQLIIYKKVRDSEIKLPRKFGFAQKKPLA